MEYKLSEYCKSQIDNETLEFVLFKMCCKKINLRQADYELYEKLSDIVDDFVEDHELETNWFENTIGTIDDLFEKLMTD